MLPPSPVAGCDAAMGKRRDAVAAAARGCNDFLAAGRGGCRCLRGRNKNKAEVKDRERELRETNLECIREGNNINFRNLERFIRKRYLEI